MLLEYFVAYIEDPGTQRAALELRASTRHKIGSQGAQIDVQHAGQQCSVDYRDQSVPLSELADLSHGQKRSGEESDAGERQNFGPRGDRLLEETDDFLGGNVISGRQRYRFEDDTVPVPKQIEVR